MRSALFDYAEEKDLLAQRVEYVCEQYADLLVGCDRDRVRAIQTWLENYMRGDRVACVG